MPEVKVRYQDSYDLVQTFEAKGPIDATQPNKVNFHDCAAPILIYVRGGSSRDRMRKYEQPRRGVSRGARAARRTSQRELGTEQAEHDGRFSRVHARWPFD